MIAIARERAPDADLRVGEMQSLRWEDGFFDVAPGFNSFVYAADITSALREAGRVSKPGTPVVIQVWGRPERCALEGIAIEAGLAPRTSFDASWTYEFPDEASLAPAMFSPGVVRPAVRQHGEARVRSAIVEALGPHRTEPGGCRLENEWHHLIASR